MNTYSLTIIVGAKTLFKVFIHIMSILLSFLCLCVLLLRLTFTLAGRNLSGRKTVMNLERICWSDAGGGPLTGSHSVKPIETQRMICKFRNSRIVGRRLQMFVRLKTKTSVREPQCQGVKTYLHHRAHLGEDVLL